MRRVLLAAGVCAAVLAAGCQEPTRVISQLPDPVYVQPPPKWSPPAPAPIRPQPTVRPDFAAAGDWLPPGGISRRWSYIIIHHSASDIGCLRQIDQWHRDKGWDGCGYDFVIGNGTGSSDGRVEVSPRWLYQKVGAHTRLSVAFARKKGLPPNHYNENGIGIVMIGNYDKVQPSPRQMQSLARLVRFLSDRCQIPESRIVTHGGVDQTHCPGHNFSLYQLKLMVRGLR